jgi:3-hydroxyethyl bacteriochlorophyllide a dehydrogenase
MASVKKIPAVIFPEKGISEVDGVDLPELGPDDVLVDIEYSCISNGTERWVLTGKLTIPDRPPLEFPHVPGYQAAGTVVEVGRNVKHIKPGDRVFSRNCKMPSSWKGSWWGGHTKIHVADAASVIALPDSVGTLEASCLLLAQVGYNGATKPKVSPGYVAVVIGEGLVGQYAGQVLRHRGAYVIISGLSEYRLEKARLYCADEVFNSAEGDFAAFIKSKYPDGIDIVVETASSNQTVRLGIDLLKYGGQLVLNGFYPPPESTLDWHWLRSKEITTYCPNSRTRKRLENTLHLIEQGQVRVKELVTHEVDHLNAPEAYRMLLDPSAEFLGIVLNWKNARAV